MTNLLKSFPKRDIIFIGIIFAVLLAIVFLNSSVQIHVSFDDEMLYVTSPRLNMDIPHKDVLSVELVDMPELGVCADGFEHDTYCCGTWQNETWGTYELCVLPELEQCIAVTLGNGHKMVFTATTNEETVALYESYRTYLGD